MKIVSIEFVSGNKSYMDVSLNCYYLPDSIDGRQDKKIRSFHRYYPFEQIIASGSASDIGSLFCADSEIELRPEIAKNDSFYELFRSMAVAAQKLFP